MTTVNSEHRLYFVFRYGDVGVTLYDTQPTLEAAKGVADRLVSQGVTKRAEVRRDGRTGLMEYEVGELVADLGRLRESAAISSGERT